MFEMLSFNYLYAIMIVSTIIILYYGWQWIVDATTTDGGSGLFIILFLIFLPLALTAVLTLEREWFYKLTGRGEELKKMNAPPPQRASPLVVPAKRYGLSVPLPGGIRLDF